jgi:hypothetical protein
MLAIATSGTRIVYASAKESSAVVETVFAGRPVAGNCATLPRPPAA